MISLNLGDFYLLCLQKLAWQAPESKVGIVNGRRVLIVLTLVANVGNGFGGDNACCTALHNGNVVPFLEEVLRNVVTGITASHNNGLLAFGLWVRAWVLGAVA